METEDIPHRMEPGAKPLASIFAFVCSHVDKLASIADSNTIHKDTMGGLERTRARTHIAQSAEEIAHIAMPHQTNNHHDHIYSLSLQ